MAETNELQAHGRRLILLRHAKSSWSDPSLPDRDRPLSSRGERDAPEMGRRLKARGARPDLVLTSHAVRARTTARVVATALGLRDENLVVEPRLYLASPDAILDIVAEQDDAARELLVVGHNPGFTELANRLLPKLSLDNLPTSGIVAVECDAARWIDIEQEARRLMYYDSPKSAAGAR